MTNGFAVDLGSLTGSSRQPAVDRCSNPDGPAPSLHPHYRVLPLLRDGPPLRFASVLCPSPFQRFEVLPSPARRQAHRSGRFSRSAREPEPDSRHLYAGHHLGSRQVPPRLIPEHGFSPGFGVVLKLSTRHQWFAHARLPGPHLTRSRRAFSTTLSTPALNRRTSWRFAAASCKTAAEGQPPSLVQHCSVG